MMLNKSVIAGYVPQLGLMYSGEVKETYLLENGSGEWIPEYMLYLQGEPVVNSYIMMYLQPKGEVIDQFLITYQKEPWEIELGDNTFQKLAGDFFSIDQNQRGGLVRIKMFDQALRLELMSAQVKSLNVQEKLEGKGTTGPYLLSYGPIIPESENVKRHGVRLSADEYQMDYQNKWITFTEPLVVEEEVEISYSYQPGSGNRVMRGMNLSGGWSNLQGNLSWFMIEELPLEVGIPSSLEGRVAEVFWKPVQWVETEGQLAWAKLIDSQFFIDSQTYEDWAYFGQVTLGDRQNYLTGEYHHQGKDFFSSLEARDPITMCDPASPIGGPDSIEKLFEGRWQVNPRLYLLFKVKHLRDNADKNPDEITQYEDTQLIKGLWQLSKISSLQMVFQRYDTGDDLIYLPTGETTQSGSVIYQLKSNQWGANLGLNFGQVKVKQQDEAAKDSSQYMGLHSQGNWNGERWNGDYSLDIKYTQLVESQTDFNPLEYFFKYNLDYKLGPGKLMLQGEEDLDEDFRRHLYRVGYQYRFADQWQGSLEYQRDIQENVDRTPTIKNKLMIHWIYYRPFLLDTRWTIGSKSIFGQTRIVREKGEGQLTWLINEQEKRSTASWQVKVQPGLELKSLLTYHFDTLQGSEDWSFALESQYQIHSGIKFNLFGEFPLWTNDPDQKSVKGRAELIFSL